MRRQGLSYGEGLHTSLRVQAPLGGGKSPTSRCPEAVGRNMGMCVIGGANPCASGGGCLYRVLQDPSHPTLHRVQCTLRQGVTGNASYKELLMIFKTTE